MQSERRDPELMRHKSAALPSLSISHMKFPALVSEVRISEKRL